MPDHTRNDLPEESTGLPAELIYATNLVVLEFSYSTAARRQAEAQDRLSEEIHLFFCGDSRMPWPTWAVDAARSNQEDYERVHQRQLDAKRWARENRCPMPGEEADEEAKAGEEAGEDAGEEAGEEADEEADEEAGRRSGRRSSSDEEARASSQGQAGEG